MVDLVKVTNYLDGEMCAWAMLLAREPEANISHRKMPEFGEHVRFVQSNPYLAWYLILGGDDEKDVVGQIYLTDGGKPGFIGNEIGVQILPQWRRQGYATIAIRALIARHGKGKYYANISPGNKGSLELFAGLGFRPVQITHLLDVD